LTVSDRHEWVSNHERKANPNPDPNNPDRDPNRNHEHNPNPNPNPTLTDHHSKDCVWFPISVL